MTFILPLDLETIILNNLAGTITIFSGIAVLVIMSLAGKFKMPTMLALGILYLFIMMFAATLGSAVYLIATLVMGIIIYTILSKTWKQ